MAERKSGNVVIFGFIGAIVLTAILLAVLVFTSPESQQSVRQVPDAGGADSGYIVDENGRLVPYGERDENAQAEVPRVLEEDEAAFDEASAEAAAQAARELVGGDPIYCESPCDCPQGQACQPGSQLCLPSPFPVYCCEKEGCPDGQACVSPDGSFGVCAE